MGKFVGTFDGRVVAEVESRSVGSSVVYEFPVYVNRVKKNRESGKYEETGDTTKIKVSVWNEPPAVQKGDIVEISASLYEATWEKKDGSEGRQLQTDWVDSIEVKFRRDDSLGSKMHAGWTELDPNAPF